MATKRPGFHRALTEKEQDVELQEGIGDGAPGDSKGTYQVRDPDVKEGVTIETNPQREDDYPPEYEDAGDGFHKVTAPVSTAKDLVTQVLHVDDDPTLSPYTFRVFFLGTYISP